MTEITVKFFKDGNDNWEVKADISGRKVIMFPETIPSKVKVLPLFDERGKL